MPAHKRFTIEERVRWGDVDAARIIFYGAYIHFFEYAETELFREVGLHYGVMFDELNIWLPRVHLECDFHRAARLDDILEVSVWVARFGNKSMKLNFEVRRKGEDELVATAHFVLAAVNQTTFETVPIPSELREKLAPYTANEDQMTTVSNNPLLDGLDEKVIDRDPIKQFQIWFNDAIEAKLPMPDAMTLATATPDGKPSARMVLLKQVDHDGFVFYTNYRSAKAAQLDANPFAALVFYWTQLDRQVRVEGSVTRTSPEESRDYFRTRPRESQIGAWASEQSEVISGREVLEQRASELETMYCERDIDCPEHWGGYRLKPERIEFWKSRVGRLHDRILYQRTADGWSISRLAP